MIENFKIDKKTGFLFRIFAAKRIKVYLLLW